MPFATAVYSQYICQLTMQWEMCACIPDFKPCVCRTVREVACTFVVDVAVCLVGEVCNTAFLFGVLSSGSCEIGFCLFVDVRSGVTARRRVGGTGLAAEAFFLPISTRASAPSFLAELETDS